MKRTHRSPHVRESGKIFDSGFQSLGSRFLSLELGFRILIVTGIPDSLSCIPDSKAQGSRFQKQKFLWFRNPNSLSWNETEFFFLVCLFLTQINWCPLSPTSPFFITIAILLSKGAINPQLRIVQPNYLLSVSIFLPPLYLSLVFVTALHIFFSALPTRRLVTCEERYSDLEKSIYLPSPSNGGFSKRTWKYEKEYDVQCTDEFVRLHPCAQLVTKQVCLTPIALVYRFSLLTWESLKKNLWNPQPHKNNLSI